MDTQVKIENIIGFESKSIIAKTGRKSLYIKNTIGINKSIHSVIVVETPEKRNYVGQSLEMAITIYNSI